jgi:hypothetical protein
MRAHAIWAHTMRPYGIVPKKIKKEQFNFEIGIWYFELKLRRRAEGKEVGF